jgi:transcriptional regulator with XRE-family HTH domain
LRQLRLDAGMRQEDLARRLRGPQSLVSKYEIGQRRLDPVELREICRALDLPLVEFVKRFEKAVGRSAAPPRTRR